MTGIQHTKNPKITKNSNRVTRISHAFTATKGWFRHAWNEGVIFALCVRIVLNTLT